MAINQKRKPLTFSKLRLAIFLIAGAVIVVVCLATLRTINKPIIDLHEQTSEIIYIPSNASFDDVVTLLQLKNWLTDEKLFTQVATLMNYPDHVKPGRYKIENAMKARELVTRLRSGDQAPINLTFNNLRTIEQLAGVTARYLECDSAEFLTAMQDTTILQEFGVNQETLRAIFIPNTYQFFWNTSPKEWLHRMKKEHDKFWTEARLHKADSLGLNPLEVSTLASIIEEETNQRDELPIIAGIYLNRLRIGMPLQACPTLKYAMGDFTVRRILRKDEEIESPYNTYKHTGLPPAPIRIPSITAIDAVLNATDHKYLFMCASATEPGRHKFARTNAEHERNAIEYQNQLNQKKIYR